MGPVNIPPEEDDNQLTAFTAERAPEETTSDQLSNEARSI